MNVGSRERGIFGRGCTMTFVTIVDGSVSVPDDVAASDAFSWSTFSGRFTSGARRNSCS